MKYGRMIWMFRRLKEEGYTEEVPEYVLRQAIAEGWAWFTQGIYKA